MAWTLTDPVTDETLSVSVQAATSPHLTRQVSDEHTTSRSGRFLSWEGAPTVPEVELSIRILTQELYEGLETWVAKPYRTIITDEFDRQWEAYFISFAATPQRAYLNDWSFVSTVRAVVFGRYA